MHMNIRCMTRRQFVTKTAAGVVADWHSCQKPKPLRWRNNQVSRTAGRRCHHRHRPGSGRCFCAIAGYALAGVEDRGTHARRRKCASGTHSSQRLTHGRNCRTNGHSCCRRSESSTAAASGDRSLRARGEWAGGAVFPEPKTKADRTNRLRVHSSASSASIPREVTLITTRASHQRCYGAESRSGTRWHGSADWS